MCRSRLRICQVVEHVTSIAFMGFSIHSMFAYTVSNLADCSQIFISSPIHHLPPVHPSISATTQNISRLLVGGSYCISADKIGTILFECIMWATRIVSDNSKHRSFDFHSLYGLQTQSRPAENGSRHPCHWRSSAWCWICTELFAWTKTMF